MRGIITLTTDFGLEDYYAGAVKGAILRLAPHVQVVDLSHCIPPQDVLAGAFVLRHAAGEFPPDTIHLAVVDPGVGSGRRPLALDSGGQLWVGPDNGLFSFALETPGWRAHEIAHPELRGRRLSPTFHGRDLFAPTAARLAAGFPLEQVGPRVADPVRLEEARPHREGGRLVGQVVHVDRFGSLITNIAEADLTPWREGWRICLGEGRVLERLCQTYSEAEPGALLALIGSAGLLEIAINGGAAARSLNLGRRAPVVVEFD